MEKIQPPPKIPFLENPEEFRMALDLQNDPEVQEYISRQNEKYLYWDEIRHHYHPKNLSSELVWGLMKVSRMFKYRKLSLGKLTFRYIITDTIMGILHQLDQQTSGSLESKSDSIAPREPLERYLVNSIMEEAIASSQLEGAVTTREVAKGLLRTGRPPKDESQHMIVNAYQTLSFLKEILNRPLSPELICEIQAKMTINTLDGKHVGRFRDNDDVHVVDVASNESVYRPPPYVEVPNLIKDLCKFINSDGEAFLHPLLKAIVLHFMIGYIHPFENGNGRTARALFYWYTMKKGYWLFEYMPISLAIKKAPGRYSRAYLFSEYDDNDLTYFIVFHLRQLDIALSKFVEYVKMKQTENEKVQMILGKDNRLNFRQSDIILRFMKHPLKPYSIREIKEIYKVVYQTARSDLDFLSSIGYCKKIKDGRKFMYQYTGRPAVGV